MNAIRRAVALASVFLLASSTPLVAGDDSGRPALGLVEGVELQPLIVHVRRLVEAAEFLGVPFDEATRAELDAAFAEDDAAIASRRIQAALDAHCLFGVRVDADRGVHTNTGPAEPNLAEGGWTQFLVKVDNEAEAQRRLRCLSPSALPLAEAGRAAIRGRWLDLSLFENRPMSPRLSGTRVEYRFLQLYSRDRGERAASFSFDLETNADEAKADGAKRFRPVNEVGVTFECAPATPVTLRVSDHDGQRTTASFVFRDARGRVHPSQAKRLAPDFFFQPQIYRADGETLRLPPGTYEVEYTRGPEYVVQRRTIEVGVEPSTESFELVRWIDPSTFGYWSGDHHIHAAGCRHYEAPTEGVLPRDMLRHCLGEDLKVGCVLTWGPCFDYQKQFFTGRVDAASVHPYLMRYDIEVSGFGSHQSGHLCLLRLKEQIPPGGNSKYHWPTLGLNTLKWAKRQGAVCGPAHSGWGLAVGTRELPNYVIPPYDSIGANEYVVDVTHEVPGPDGEPVPAIDFISTVDTVPTWELNIWYHTLNCGFRTRASGETDFPCIFDDRVGIGRSYVRLEGELDYDRWCEGIRDGRSYVGDGLSHLLDFTVNGVEVGSGDGETSLDAPGRVPVTAKVAAYLDEVPDPDWDGNREIPLSRRDRARPYWHVERARIVGSRTVPVELIVNGQAVDRRIVEADGRVHEISFDAEIEHSSWVALRILASSHTNPVFVLVDGEPIRASRRSAQWCLDSVDECWSQKQRFYAAAERDDAIAAYEHARRTYRRILAESVAD